MLLVFERYGALVLPLRDDPGLTGQIAQVQARLDHCLTEEPLMIFQAQGIRSASIQCSGAGGAGVQDMADCTIWLLSAKGSHVLLCPLSGVMNVTRVLGGPWRGLAGKGPWAVRTSATGMEEPSDDLVPGLLLRNLKSVTIMGIHSKDEGFPNIVT